MDERVFQRTTDNYSVETFTKGRPDLGVLFSETKWNGSEGGCGVRSGLDETTQSRCEGQQVVFLPRVSQSR